MGEDLCVDPLAEFTGQHLSAMVPQFFSLTAQLSTFQAEHVFAGPVGPFIQ